MNAPHNQTRRRKPPGCSAVSSAPTQPVRTIRVEGSPFLVGRHSKAALTIPSPTVSNIHAELRVESGVLYVKDLGSTNGTFINGERIDGEFTVSSGDLLQFAEIVFRVGLESGRYDSKTIAGDSSDRALALIQFDKLMSDGPSCRTFSRSSRSAICASKGYEILGRSRLFGLTTPHSMFSAAAVLDLESELSRMMRSEGVTRAPRAAGSARCCSPTRTRRNCRSKGVLEFSLRELREAGAHGAAWCSRSTKRPSRASSKCASCGSCSTT